MKKVFHLLYLLVIINVAMPSEHGFSFASGPLLFKPLTANTFEPRLGLIWHMDGNRLRLDIGNSVDMVQYRFETGQQLLTFGSDFFTYTLLQGEKNFHFPVDAVDYLFGVNINYADTLDHAVLSSRLRLSHISAHFVDGHFEGSFGRWKNGHNPRVYSREFFDLTVGYEPVRTFRGYLGIVYLWHVDPTTINPLFGYAGGEYHHTLNTLFSGFAAYQCTLSDLLPKHEIYAGIKLGEWNGRGTKFFYTFFSGNNIHGEYFDRTDVYSGVGFTIDF
ncbi:MAG: DUF1207 domain-containing protein [Bacteroidota bacterium]